MVVRRNALVVVSAVTFAVAGGAGVKAGSIALRQSMDPVSQAEANCGGVLPAGAADSRAYQLCVQGEALKSPIEVALTPAVVASLGLIVAAGSLVLRRKSGIPRTERSVRRATPSGIVGLQRRAG